MEDEINNLNEKVQDMEELIELAEETERELVIFCFVLFHFISYFISYFISFYFILFFYLSAHIKPNLSHQ